MLKMGSRFKAYVAGLAVAGAMAGAAVPAQAGDYSGDFMVRVQGTVVNPDVESDVQGLDVSDEVIPALTLSYFFNKNIAVELFCCFAKHQVELGGSDVGDFWIFPPALTLQYHFDSMGAFKPYVGAGIQYIAPFDEETSLGSGNLEIEDALGFTLQAGVDVEIGQGWYLNADVKKTFIEHDIDLDGDRLTTIDLDPWIFSLGVGYRFNLSDVFGSRHAEAVPMK
jgi:outer membrane protein